MSKFMATKQVIAKLKELDPTGDMPVVVVGHFGEACEVDSRSWYVRDTYTTDGRSWRKGTEPFVKITLKHQLNSKELKKYGLTNDKK